MKHLIDEFKITANYFERYTRHLRPITYTSYENSLTFSCMSKSVELVILFAEIPYTNDISLTVTVTDYSESGNPIKSTRERVMVNAGESLINFDPSELNETYAVVMVEQLTKAKDTQQDLINVIEKTHQLLSAFIRDINELELITLDYYQQP